MRYSNLVDQAEFIKFLGQYGIQAIPPSLVHESHLHWWQVEGTRKHWEEKGIKYFVDIALVQGYFFLELTEKGFYLYLQNARDDWYNLVRIWSIDVPEQIFLQELSELVDHQHIGEIYEYDSNVIRSIRRTSHDLEWERSTKDLDVSRINSNLKEMMHEFEEGFISATGVHDYPNRPKEFMKLKRAIQNLLSLFIQEELRKSTNCLIMHRYFPTNKYEHYVLPKEYQSMLFDLGKAFEEPILPSQNMIERLIAQAQALHV